MLRGCSLACALALATAGCAAGTSSEDTSTDGDGGVVPSTSTDGSIRGTAHDSSTPVDAWVAPPGIDANGVDVVQLFDAASPIDASTPFDAGSTDICNPNSSTYQNIYSVLFALGAYTTCQPNGSGCNAQTQCCMLAPAPLFPNMCLTK
jgi:hypothetical protein